MFFVGNDRPFPRTPHLVGISQKKGEYPKTSLKLLSIPKSCTFFSCTEKIRQSRNNESKLPQHLVLSPSIQSLSNYSKPVQNATMPKLPHSRVKAPKQNTQTTTTNPIHPTQSLIRKKKKREIKNYLFTVVTVAHTGQNKTNNATVFADNPQNRLNK